MQLKSFPNRHGGTFEIDLVHSRNSLLTDFGRATLQDRYLRPGEDFQDMFGRVATWYAQEQDHAQRLYDYMSRLWFMPATPILSNGGTDRGNPISCFLNYVDDSLESIDQAWSENTWLASKGGGIGTYWGDVRGIDESVGGVGTSSGVIPFLKVQDSKTLAISQGSLRRGSSAAYLDIDHPEIEEFIDIRRPTGDPNRRCLNIHHGVNITDDFMEAVRLNLDWDLIGRKDGRVRKTVSARKLWAKILQTRMETGEPYMLFIDTANRERPEHQRELGLEIRQSNLCSEITLPTGPDRTAVCCLSSLNLEKFDEWNGNTQFIHDVLFFLDEVLQDFIDRTEGVRGFERARFSAVMERSIGLGTMGFHAYLQKHGVPFEGVMATSHNKRMFRFISHTCDAANRSAADVLGPCPDSDEAFNKGLTSEHLRWSNCTAVAPTASISIIAANTSPGIEPYTANIYTQKTLSGSFTVKNRYLDAILKERLGDEGAKEVWSSIIANDGSVQHLSELTGDEKEVFKTAFEIDPAWQLQHMADRADKIHQAVSNNLFLKPDISTKELNAIHFNAWKRGVKSLYYCRSKSMSRAQSVKHTAGEMPQPEQSVSKYEECMVCQ